MVRGNLATIFDGLFPSSSGRDVEPQVLLDMVLLELDRGIDLLSLGDKPKLRGPTERRAIAYWLIVRVIQRMLTTGSNSTGNSYFSPLAVSSLEDPFASGGAGIIRVTDPNLPARSALVYVASSPAGESSTPTVRSDFYTVAPTDGGYSITASPTSSPLPPIGVAT